MTLQFKFFLCCIAYAIGALVLCFWGESAGKTFAGIVYGAIGVFVLDLFVLGGLHKAMFGEKA
jgi:hypothetical protein